MPGPHPTCLPAAQPAGKTGVRPSRPGNDGFLIGEAEEGL